jgi:hypothetical protein
MSIKQFQDRDYHHKKMILQRGCTAPRISLMQTAKMTASTAASHPLGGARLGLTKIIEAGSFAHANCRLGYGED